MNSLVDDLTGDACRYYTHFYFPFCGAYKLNKM